MRVIGKHLAACMAIWMASASWAVMASGMVPTEAAGIPLGSTPTEVKQAMKERAGSSLDEEAPDHLTFKGGDLSGKPVKTRKFSFTGGKMVKLDISFVFPDGKDARGGWLADQLRTDLYQMLQQKYGPAKDQAGNNWYHVWGWSWPDPEVRGGTRTINLFHGWHDAYMTLIYAVNPPPAAPTPAPAATPSNRPKPPNEL